MLNCYTPVVEPARVAPSVTTRPDGRAWHEARRPRIALGVVARVAGSARVALGGTHVLSTVTGPHAPAAGDAAAAGGDADARGRLACTLGFAPFARAHLPAASPPPAASLAAGACGPVTVDRMSVPPSATRAEPATRAITPSAMRGRRASCHARPSGRAVTEGATRAGSTTGV